MRCLQIAISSLKWKARSFCIWASTGGKPSKTDHLQSFRLAGTECAWERTSSPATECSISPDISSVTRNGRAPTTIYGLLPSSSGRIRGGRSEHERSVPTEVESVCMKPTSTLRGYQRHRLLVDPQQCASFSGMAARMTTRTHFSFQFTRRYVDPSPEPRDVMRRFPA